MGAGRSFFFGFTHCPDICPATLQMLSTARRTLAGDDDSATLPDILLISVDPDRDTPEILRDYTAHFGDGVSGATGPYTELAKLAGMLGVYFEKEETDSKNYNVVHSAHVFVIGPERKYNAVFSAPHSVKAFVSDLPIVMAAK